jgi:hypothetical protein
MTGTANFNAAAPIVPILNLSNGPTVSSLELRCAALHVNFSGRLRADDVVEHVTYPLL